MNSIRFRLALWNVGVLAAVLLVLGATLRYTMQRDLMAGVDHDLEKRAEAMVSRPPPDHFGSDFHRPDFHGPGHDDHGQNHGPFQPFDPGRQGPPFHGGDSPPHPQNRPEFHPKLLNIQGQGLFVPEDGPWDAVTFHQSAQGQTRYSTVTITGQPVRVFSTPYRDGGTIQGVVQVAQPIQTIQDEVTQLTRTLLTLVPLALGIAAFGGAFLTDRALRPVRRINSAVGHIEAANLSGRLPVTGNDEFAELATSFNGMLGRLATAFQALEQSVERQRRFTADASHELRTPLTVIKARASLALLGERKPSEYQKDLAAIDQASDQMNKIVQDLLLLARVDAGEAQYAHTSANIGAILERAVQMVAPTIQTPIFCELKTERLTVTGDADALTRVFSNLLSNAGRHTPPEGRITVSARSEDSRVLIQIRDTGEGIAPEHLPHLFERFYRIDAARSSRQGGTGLGLAICRSILEAHRGTIRIESTVGQGTTVHISLPH